MATTIQLHFDEGLVVRLTVAIPVLSAMLEFLPGMQGVRFRKNLKFAIVGEGRRRRMMSPVQISIVEGGLETR